MNTNAADINNAIRKEMRNKRMLFYSNSFEYECFSKSCQVLVLSSKIWNEAENIALYLPFRGEVDTHILIDSAYKQNKNLFFPRCLSYEEAHADGIMEFVHIPKSTYSTSFESGSYGIQEPKKNLSATLLPQKTLVLLPCLAYNLQGFRLGYGGGYYDRLLSQNKYFSMILCFNFQYNTQIIPQCWDIPVNFIANEKEVLCSNQSLLSSLM